MTTEEINLVANEILLVTAEKIAQTMDCFSYNCGRTRDGFVEYLKNNSVEAATVEAVAKAFFDFAASDKPHAYEAKKSLNDERKAKLDAFRRAMGLK